MSFFTIFYENKYASREITFFFFYSFSLFFKVCLSLKSVSNIFRNFSCLLACLWRITIYNCCVCCLFHFFFLSFETFIRLSRLSLKKFVVYLDSCAHVWIWHILVATNSDLLSPYKCFQPTNWK